MNLKLKNSISNNKDDLKKEDTKDNISNNNEGAKIETKKNFFSRVPKYVWISSSIFLTASICLSATLPFLFKYKNEAASKSNIQNNQYNDELNSFLYNDISRSKSDDSVDLFVIAVNASFDHIQQITMIIGSLLEGNEVYLYIDESSESRLSNYQVLNEFSNFNLVGESAKANKTIDKMINSFNYVSNMTDKNINLYINDYHYNNAGKTWLNEIDFSRLETFNLISDGWADVGLDDKANKFLVDRNIDMYFPYKEVDNYSLWQEISYGNYSGNDFDISNQLITFTSDWDGDGTRDMYNSSFTGQPYFDNVNKPNPYNQVGVGLDKAIQYLKDTKTTFNNKTGYDYFIDVFGINSNGSDTYPEELFEGFNNLIYSGNIHPGNLSKSEYQKEADAIIKSYNSFSSKFSNPKMIYKGHPSLSQSDLNDLIDEVNDQWNSATGTNQDWFIVVDPKKPIEIMMIIDEFQDNPSTNTYFYWSMNLASTITGTYWEMNRKQPYQYTVEKSFYQPAQDWYGRNSKVVNWDEVIVS